MILEKVFQEATEVSASEVSKAPDFFKDLHDSKDNPDTPVKQAVEADTPVTYLTTRNEGLEGDVHPITGVPFERSRIELNNGEIIEGVFPKFDSVFEANIPEELFTETDYKQFKSCNEQLLDAIERDPDLKSKFTKEQIEQIKDGVSDGGAPDGYVWHHCPEPGVIKLVDFETHAGTGHTGGRTVWGGGNENR